MTKQENDAAGVSRLQQALAAAGAIEPSLHAFTHLPEHTSTVFAEGPLAGVPVAVKDLIDTADMPTTYGSKVFKDHQPTADAWIVKRLRDAGAVIFGKTVTTEFAWRDPGPTVNPWNAGHSPGGSSSGSAAAVGAGIVDIALGTQTVGSVIRPAAYCGAVGYKPTYGSIPTTGVHDLAASLDHLGFITSDVYWAAVCQQVVVEGKSSLDTLADFAPGKKPAKIGVYRSSQWAQVDADVQQNFDAVVRRLEEAGVVCVETCLGVDIRELNKLTVDILAYEARRDIYNEIKDHGDTAGPNIRELVQQGLAFSEADYAGMLSRLAQLRAGRDALLDGMDAIITIVSPTPAPKGLAKTGDASFCAPATLLGLPSMTTPSGLSSSLLPLGVQLIGHAGQDLALLRTGQWLRNMLPSLKAPAYLR